MRVVNRFNLDLDFRLSIDPTDKFGGKFHPYSFLFRTDESGFVSLIFRHLLPKNLSMNFKSDYPISCKNLFNLPRTSCSMSAGYVRVCMIFDLGATLSDGLALLMFF